MSYQIQILPSAQRALARLPKRDRVRIDEHILSLAENPRSMGASPLKGTNKRLWRIRVGDFRILYEIRDDRLIVIVVDVGTAAMFIGDCEITAH